MKRFAGFTAQDYINLEETLSDGMLHIYKNRELPPGCTPSTARIGMERRILTDPLDPDAHPAVVYMLHIDSGIIAIDTGTRANAIFRQWLAAEDAQFRSLHQMQQFLYMIGTLFYEE